MSTPRTFPLPTDTAHVRFESRQYRLLKWDLGEGVPRSSLKVGAAVFLPWAALCWIVGVPLVDGLILWLGPPAIATWRAMSRDEGGRLRLRAWADRLAWMTKRHRPIVNGDTASWRAPQPQQTEIVFMTVPVSPKDPRVSEVP